MSDSETDSSSDTESEYSDTEEEDDAEEYGIGISVIPSFSEPSNSNG
jgi:hypothetical protein